MKGSARRKLDQLNFMEQVRECRDNGYLLSSRKMGSGAFSKVYLAYATHERLRHNPKLASDLRGKRHVMVAIKIISTAEAPVEFSQKFLPREISSLNTTYKHLNVVQLYETYQNSRRSYLVLELAARGDLLEHINSVSDHRCRPGLEEDEARGLFWQLVSTVAHCHSSGIVHRDLKCENILLDDQGLLKLSDFGFANRSGLKNSLLSTFCGSVAYTAPEILMSKMYNGEQADLWSLGIILYTKVTGKLPFKERQLHRMLHLMHQGPTFRPGMSPECQDLIRGLLQLRPRARLDLQQVAAHCWMLPIAHALFLTMLSSSPGVVGPPLPLLTCHGCWLQRNQPSPSCQQPLTTWSLAETHSLRGCSSNSSVPSTGDLTTRVLLAQCPSAQTQSQEEVQSAQLGLQSTVAASVGVGASW